MLVCPTSELPICPSGRPTESPEAWSAVKGMSLLKRSSCGVPARRMALSSRCCRMPQPSRTARSTRWEGFITPDPNIESAGLRSPPTRALSLPGVLCCARREMEPSLARVKAFDWLRGLAVLVMIECHAMVLLRKDLLATPAAKAMDWLNGLVAPSFIFAAGFSLPWCRCAPRGRADRGRDDCGGHSAE